MKVIDFTHSIREGMQIFPGDPEPSIVNALNHGRDYCHVDRLNLGSHTGTHIDAPYHFFTEGKPINAYSADWFVGSGRIIDVRGKGKEEAITVKDIGGLLESDEAIDFVLFLTGWDAYWGQESYLVHPYIGADCAKALVAKGIRIVGTDALNVDPTLQEVFPAHDIFLGNDVLIVENLTNLEAGLGEAGIFSLLPLAVEGTDGSPIRAVLVCHE